MEQEKNIKIYEGILLEVKEKVKKRKGVIVDKKYFARFILNDGDLLNSDLYEINIEVTKEDLEEFRFGDVFYLLSCDKGKYSEEELLQAIEDYKAKNA